MIQFTPAVPKAPGEELRLAMDFSEEGWLLAGESIVSAVWSAQVYSGTDPDPNAMISGAATLTGTTVEQLVIGGLEGVAYLMLCTLTLSTGRDVIGRALLKVAMVG